MNPDKLAELALLTAHERRQLTDAKIAELTPHITTDDVERAVDKIQTLVEARFEQGREKRTGFAVLVIDRGAKNNEKRFNRSVWQARGTEVRAVALIRVDVDTWKQNDPLEDKYAMAAITKADIVAECGADSGTVDNSLLEDKFSPEELELNIPGAILVGNLIFSVSGLESDNDKEIAEAIAMDCLESVEARLAA